MSSNNSNEGLSPRSSVIMMVLFTLSLICLIPGVLISYWIHFLTVGSIYLIFSVSERGYRRYIKS